MKFRKTSFALLIILFFSSQIFSQDYEPTGTKLCDYICSYMERNNLKPKKQEIINSPNNNFPYNILITYKSTNINNNDNLIFLFKTEEAYENIDLIVKFCEQAKKVNCNITIALIYGSQYRIPRYRVTNGTDTFVRNLDSNKENFVYNINLKSNKNSISANAMGKSSPSWMIKNTFEAYINNNLTQDLPFYYLSQLSTYRFGVSNNLYSFSTKDIPTITTNFITDTFSKDTVYNVLSNIISSYGKFKTEDIDYHSIMFRIGKKTFWFSEYTIVKTILIISLLSLFFIFILSFVNSNLRNKAWVEIKKNWYTIPVTLFLSILGFYLAKGIYYLIYKGTPANPTAFGLVLFELCLGSALVSIFYLLLIGFYKDNYSERSLDFLVLMTTFVNQFLFCLVDISLFPLFMVICIMSILSLILRKNWIHILIFILMIVIFFPYILRLNELSDSSLTASYFRRGNIYIFWISCILLPIYLLMFRILTAIRQIITKKRIFILIISLTYIFIFTTLGIINTNISNKEDKIGTITHNTNVSRFDDIEVTYSDRRVFGDVIRTINFYSLEPAQFVKVSVKAGEKAPILYSEYDYTTDSNNISSFDVPYNPPQKMSFTYGTTDIPTIITVEALFLINKEKNEYKSLKKVINIGN